jgi:small subunit ribosomal protein S13
MLRIAGVLIPGKKRLVIALTAVKGVGVSMSQSILDELKIEYDKRADDLTEKQEGDLRTRIEKELVEGELTRKVSMDIKRIQDIGTYRGYRHRRKLPVRGQTSRRNARTKRGKKTAGGSGRQKLTKT